MATTGSGTVTVAINGYVQKVGGFATGKFNLREQITATLIGGTGELGFNKAYKLTVAATTTPAAIDLSGTTEDDFGEAIALTEVLAILVTNTSTSGNLIIGGESTDIVALGAGNEMVVHPASSGGTPGVSFKLAPDASGMAVTATTADTVSYQSSAGTVNGTILILGR